MKYVHLLYQPGDGGLDRVAIFLANEMAVVRALVEAIVAAIGRTQDAAMRDIAQAYSIKASAQDHLRLAATVLEGRGDGGR